MKELCARWRDFDCCGNSEDSAPAGAVVTVKRTRKGRSMAWALKDRKALSKKRSKIQGQEDTWSTQGL